jgi:hypothetical protein
MSPFNHIFMYYQYHAQDPVALQLIAQIFNVLVDSEPDLTSQLEDTLENRMIMMKRIKVIRTLRIIKTFLENLFRLEKLEGDAEKPKPDTQPPNQQQQMFCYTLAKIYEDFGNMMTSFKCNSEENMSKFEIIKEQINFVLCSFLDHKEQLISKIEHPLETAHP